MEYKILRDNIVSLKEPVEAIVNSANRFMSRGGGVCGAIHKAAGFEFTEYCFSLGGLSTMGCKITPGFDLQYNYVIHALAPIYIKSSNPKEELVNTYLNAINLATVNGIKSIAFPILGAGHYGYPLEIAINCAMDAFSKLEEDSTEIKLICYTDEEYSLAKKISFMDEIVPY